MVCLAPTDACRLGKHAECKGKEIPELKRQNPEEVVLGGKICTCSCHQEKNTAPQLELGQLRSF